MFILFNNHGYKLEMGELIYHDTIRKGFVGLAYQGKDIVSKFIIEDNSLRDFGP
jgi:hypothetical protein